MSLSSSPVPPCLLLPWWVENMAWGGGEGGGCPLVMKISFFRPAEVLGLSVLRVPSGDLALLRYGTEWRRWRWTW